MPMHNEKLARELLAVMKELQDAGAEWVSTEAIAQATGNPLSLVRHTLRRWHCQADDFHGLVLESRKSQGYRLIKD